MTSDLKNKIEELYNFKITNVKNIKGGRSKLYKLVTTKGEFVVKQYNNTYKKEDVNREVMLNTYLLQNGINATKYILNTKLEYYFELNEYIYVVYEFIKGKTKNMFSGNKENLTDSAKVLGKLLLAMKNIDLPQKNNYLTMDVLFDKERINNCMSSIENLIYHANKLESIVEKEMIISDLKYKKQLVQKIYNMDFKKINDITIAPCHGDFNILQCIYKDNKIDTVIDFADAKRIPVMWEIIRSYNYIDQNCKDGYFDLENFNDYIKEVEKVYPLTGNDRRYGIYIYFVQLATSLFGYREYILNTDLKSKEILEFGIYRNKVCKYLEQNLDRISEKIQKRSV